MANDDVRKVVLLSRYTTLTGVGVFETAPFSVREFDNADITWWRGVAIHANDFEMNVRIQQSPNLVDWRDAGQTDVEVEEDTEVTTHVEFQMDWARARIEITDEGMTPSVTCWGAGNFLARKR